VQTLTIIGAVVALVATSVGVMAAIEQLTLRARLRRTAELAQALSGHENDPERQTVLRSIHDVAVARLVSGWLLPWWRFSELAVSFLAGPVPVGWTIAANGWSGLSLIVTVASFIYLALASRRGVRLYLERQRVAREYLSGAKITPPHIDILHLMEGGTRAEFVVGLLVSAGTTLAAAGVGTLVHSGPNSEWGIAFVVCGLIIAWSPSNWLRARAVRPLATNTAQ
jgi:hypothetical protein